MIDLIIKYYRCRGYGRRGGGDGSEDGATDLGAYCTAVTVRLGDVPYLKD